MSGPSRDDIRARAERSVARAEALAAARAARPPSTAPKPLTEPQQRMLAKVRERGEVKYNGRARRTVVALADAGLVTYDFDLIPHAKGGGITFTEQFIVRPTEV